MDSKKKGQEPLPAPEFPEPKEVKEVKETKETKESIELKKKIEEMKKDFEELRSQKKHIKRDYADLRKQAIKNVIDRNKKNKKSGGVFKTREDYSLIVLNKNFRFYKKIPLEYMQINGTYFLVSIEIIDGEPKVDYLDIYPEPSFDLEEVLLNRHKIKRNLTIISQKIEEYEKLKFKDDPNFANYDIKDIYMERFLLEYKLNAIKYGIKTQYVCGLEDGKKHLIGKISQGRIKIQKFTERNIITEASERKKVTLDATMKEVQKLINVNKKRKFLVPLLLIGLVIFFVAGMISFYKFGTYNTDTINEEVEKRTKIICGDMHTNYKTLQSQQTEQMAICTDIMKNINTYLIAPNSIKEKVDTGE